MLRSAAYQIAPLSRPLGWGAWTTSSVVFMLVFAFLVPGLHQVSHSAPVDQSTTDCGEHIPGAHLDEVEGPGAGHFDCTLCSRAGAATSEGTGSTMAVVQETEYLDHQGTSTSIGEWNASAPRGPPVEG